MGHPSEIDEIFDAISYSKGACVIRMLHNYIGDSVFNLPFSHPLHAHSYSMLIRPDSRIPQKITDFLYYWALSMHKEGLLSVELPKGDASIPGEAQVRKCHDGASLGSIGICKWCPSHRDHAHLDQSNGIPHSHCMHFFNL